MTYELTRENLANLIKVAMQSGEFSQILKDEVFLPVPQNSKDNKITKEHVLNEVSKQLISNAPAIMAALGQDRVTMLNELGEKIVWLKKSLGTYAGDDSSTQEEASLSITGIVVLKIVFKTLSSLFLRLLVITVLFGALMAVLIYDNSNVNIFSWLSVYLNSLGSAYSQSAAYSQWSVVLFIVAIVLFYLVVRDYRLVRNELLRKKKVEIRNTHENKSNSIQEKISDYERRIASITRVLDEIVTSIYIKPAIREILNQSINYKLEMNLVSKLAQGLSEVPNSDYETPTKKKMILVGLLKNMNGGSIGVAGPRGVGKSTLIRSFCRSNFSSNEGGSARRDLSVFISVPVKYDAREFILQIFSSVCKEVLRSGGSTADLGGEDEAFTTPLPTMIFQRILGNLPAWRNIFITLLVLGMIGIITSMRWNRTVLYNEVVASQPTPVATSTSTPLSLTPTLSVSALPIVQTPVSVAAVAITAQPESNLQDQVQLPSYLDVLIDLGISPNLLWNISLLLLSISGAGYFIYWLDAFSRQPKSVTELNKLISDREKLLKDLDSVERSMGFNSGEFPKGDSGKKRDLLLQKISRVEQALQKEKRKRKDLEDKKESLRNLEDIHASKKNGNYFSMDICKLARRHIKNIRFQQSFSSGSSGTIKLPLSLEANLEYAASLSKNQMSLPEIVEEYKDFVSKLTANEKCRVIIGIDELDKIASVENARLFINEIKAIFGIHQCFYLLSVSENAMSSYERRGLPFRDEFDSAFDQVLHLDYLDYGTSRKLLSRRVIGMPPKFMDLVYVLSGGLPRDLIRYCRLIYEYAQTLPNEVSFTGACKQIITDEIRSKIRATNILIGDMEIPSISYELLSDINQLELNVTHTDEVIEILDRMEAFIFHTDRQLSDEKVGSDVVNAEIIKVKAFHVVIRELIYYIYFLMTVFAFFMNGEWRGNQTNYSTFINNSRGEDLFFLAQSRQAFSISPYHAYGLITKFREVYNNFYPQGNFRAIGLDKSANEKTASSDTK